MRKLLGTLIFSSLMMSGQAMALTCPAEGFVQDAASAFMGAARRGSPQAFSVAAGRYADLRGLALFALGPYRRDLPANMEGKYVSLAKSFMGRFMAENSSSLSGGALAITSCSGNTISGRFSSGSSIVFRLSGNSRIEDVSVSGVSIAQAMRSKFTGIIHDHGGDINALISYLSR
ncbi:MAG: ABC transporter substrate-binding protein [Alphaproteobacteria bacterium]|nr:ABC transporter substrate-binding protein [Alphaproteobacteria bacterium]